MAQVNKLRKAKSLFSTTLSTGIGTGTGDTLTPNSVTGLPTDTEVTLTIDRIDSGGTATPSLMERITGTISGGNLINYTRAVEGTEQAHASGAVVEYIWNGDDWNDHIDHHLVEHNDNGTHKAALVTTLKATAEEVATGTEDAKIVTPLAMANVTNSVFSGIQTASDGATVTFDLGNGIYRKHKVVLGGNRTLALLNASVGQTFIIDLIQDATGSRTVTWFTTIKWVYGSAPTLTTTANKIDSFGFICTSSGNYQGYIIGQGL